jgi:hypothetical protein
MTAFGLLKEMILHPAVRFVKHFIFMLKGLERQEGL